VVVVSHGVVVVVEWLEDGEGECEEEVVVSQGVVVVVVLLVVGEDVLGECEVVVVVSHGVVVVVFVVGDVEGDDELDFEVVVLVSHGVEVVDPVLLGVVWLVVFDVVGLVL
jgi:hypothetical protein